MGVKMEKSIFKYILKYSSRQQIMLTIMAALSFPVLYIFYEMPKQLPLALLEGMDWDSREKEYKTLSELRAYCARVASTVGVMMCVLMRVRDKDILARYGLNNQFHYHTTIQV